MNNAIQQAIKLGKQGIPVFPVNADKTPACKHGFKNAATEEDIIQRLFANAPKASLVGIATGAASGLDSLDIDPRHGGDKWLEAYADKVPVTRCHKTRSGGWHYIFRHAEGLRCSSGRIAEGVDVRADGGSLIWWPSAGFPVLSDATVAPWPDWLLAAALPPPRPVLASVVEFPYGTGYATAAIRHAADAVANAPNGQRNHTLNKEAFSLLRFATTGNLTPDEILTPLAQAALSSGLDRREVISTLESALRARGIA